MGFDHVDTRVRSVKSVEGFYDRLMPALGMTEKTYSLIDAEGNWVKADATRYNIIEYYEPEQAGRVGCFMGFIEDAQMQPVGTRIAFRIAPGQLDEWRKRLQEFGARNIELSESPQEYPAIFFEDPAGTKLELLGRKAAS
ncbi:MAG: hypothetical protein JO018_05860 [Candidatus Eremiobacteraeota bacterium]|nr:hypothetical protein [Candidatus Eremiobacteraeota bacterium]